MTTSTISNIRNCKHCGIEFTRRPSNKGKYCGRVCFGLDKRRPNDHKVRACVRCGLTFIAQSPSSKVTHCSIICSSLDRQLPNDDRGVSGTVDRQKARASKKKRYESNPELRSMYSAHRLAREAHPVAKPCDVCGGEATDRHHDDYSKPLEIRWLCVKCHRAHHKAERKEKLLMFLRSKPIDLSSTLFVKTLTGKVCHQAKIVEIMKDGGIKVSWSSYGNERNAIFDKYGTICFGKYEFILCNFNNGMRLRMPINT